MPKIPKVKKILKVEKEEITKDEITREDVSYVDRQVGHVHHEKEFSVIRYVTKTFPDNEWIINKIVPNDIKIRFRPDLRMDMDDRIIFIEIDEKQHKGYNTTTETDRILKLCNDAYYKNILFIRFNPDDFVHDTKYTPGCWEKNDEGELVFDKKQWEFRLNKLRDVIIECMNCVCTSNIEIFYLFYDKTSDKITNSVKKGIKCKIPEYEIKSNDNELISKFADKLKSYKRLPDNDVTLLKVGYFIAYIKLTDSEFRKGGRISEIKKWKNYYIITYSGNYNTKWSLRSDNSIIFYREKSMKELNIERQTKWKLEQKLKLMTPAEQIVILIDKFSKGEPVCVTEEEWENSEDAKIQRQITDIIYNNYGGVQMEEEFMYYIENFKNNIYPINCECEYDLFGRRDSNDRDFEKICTENEELISQDIGCGGGEDFYDHLVNKIKFFKDLKMDFSKCNIVNNS
jgi:hypothetical protein